MGKPVTGAWMERTGMAVPYAGAAKWGTGINPVHQYYGGGSPRQPKPTDITPPSESTEGYIESQAPWGYSTDDFAGIDAVANLDEAIHGVPFVQDDYPSWDETTPDIRAEVPVNSSAPWNASTRFKNILRSVLAGPGNRGMIAGNATWQTPTETVSEGWINKPASGMHEGDIPASEPADNSQVFIQTSQVQRNKQLSNQRAVMRVTDAERTPIGSRVAPMKLKVYSQGERLYDMYPYEANVIPRPFYFHRAATGRVDEMEPNEMYVTSPLQRTVPADPSMGDEDLGVPDGYTEEDIGYY
jgi:hypothetical protein